jgi:hypothetical protein
MEDIFGGYMTSGNLRMHMVEKEKGSENNFFAKSY